MRQLAHRPIRLLRRLHKRQPTKSPCNNKPAPAGFFSANIFMELIKIQPDTAINPGAVVFFTGSGFIDSTISEFTGSEFIHVAMAFNDCAGNLLFIECQGGTPKRIVDASYYEGRLVCVYQTHRPWRMFRDQAVQGLGVVGYDYIEAGLAGLEDLVRQEIGWKIETHASGHICSTFIAQLLGVSNETVSPGDLLKILGGQ